MNSFINFTQFCFPFYVETCRSEEASAVESEFEKHVESVNRLLDDLGFPRQRGIDENNLQEFLDNQLKNCSFILKAYENETCAPGNLVIDNSYNFLF